MRLLQLLYLLLPLRYAFKDTIPGYRNLFHTLPILYPCLWYALSIHDPYKIINVSYTEKTLHLLGLLLDELYSVLQ